MNFDDNFAPWNEVMAPRINPTFFNKVEVTSGTNIGQIQNLFNLYDNTMNSDQFDQEIIMPEEQIEPESNEPQSDQSKLDKAKEITKKQSDSYKPTSNNKKSFRDKKEFVTTMNNSYKRALAKHGYNPQLSLMLVAQDAFESGWGEHPSGDYNFGGMTTKGNDWHKQTGSHKWKDFKSIDHYTDTKVTYLDNKFSFYSFASMQNITRTMQRLADAGYCPRSPKYGSRIGAVYAYILKRNYV